MIKTNKNVMIRLHGKYGESIGTVMVDARLTNSTAFLYDGLHTPDESQHKT